MKQGWTRTRLGDALVRTESVNPLANPAELFQYIDVSSVSNESFRIETVRTLAGRDAPSRARKLVKTGDVLLATVRPTLRRVAIVPPEFDGQVCSTGYYVCRAKPGIESRYVFYYLISNDFIDLLGQIQKGASYPAVTESEVRDQPFAFPPLSEQRRIVAILDRAFQAIDTAKANTEKNLLNARALFDSHLESICGTDGNNWPVSSLGNECDISMGQSPEGTSYNAVGHGVPLINGPSEFSRDQFGLTVLAKYTTSPTKMCRTGDLILCVRGATTGRTNIAGFDACIGRGVASIRAHANQAWINYCVSNLRKTILDRGTGSTFPNVSGDTLHRLEIPLPPIAERVRLAGLLDSSRERSLRLESLYQRKLAALDELKQSLLHQAFSGDL